MIEILHYLKDPNLWEFMGIFLIMGNAGFLSSAVVLPAESVGLGGLRCPSAPLEGLMHGQSALNHTRVSYYNLNKFKVYSLIKGCWSLWDTPFLWDGFRAVRNFPWSLHGFQSSPTAGQP